MKQVLRSGKVRHPLFTGLSALSFTCVLVTLLAWAMASLYPRYRFRVTWHDGEHRIVIRSKMIGWSGEGVIFCEESSNYRDADEDHVTPGYENAPVILLLRQHSRDELRVVRMLLSRLARPDTRSIIWKSSYSDLEHLLRLSRNGSLHGESSDCEHYSFGTAAVWFGLLPFIWLIGAWLGHRRMKASLRVGCCRKCGYDLRASPDRCPECGTPINPRLN